MESLKMYIPEGMRDILFEECSCKNETISRIRRLFINCGFQEISSPTLEFYDVFHGENMSIEQEKTYKLFDNRGRILVLKPDTTVPIARIVASKLKKLTYPIRLCYSSNVFRVNDGFEGKINESIQCGVEIIGINNCKADSELIILAIKSILAIGIEKFEIELGEANFFKAIIDDTSLAEKDKEKLRTLVERKNFNEIRSFVDLNKDNMEINSEVLMRLPELFGGPQVIETARALTNNKAAIKALENVQEIYSTLESIGLEHYVSIDLGMVQHINYYTGITFKGYCGKSGKEILSGGRYDNLIRNFGIDLNATGFAIDVDNVLLSLQQQMKIKNNTTKLLIHYEENVISTAYSLAEQLRKIGFITELSLLNHKELAISYAAERGFNEVLVVEDSESLEVLNVESMMKKKIRLNDYVNVLGGRNE